MLIPDSESIPLIRAALERGQRVKMTVSGRSMKPFIHDGDIVELAPAGSMPQLGSVVLAELPDGYYPLHRIVARQSGTAWLLRGDNNGEPDGLLIPDKIIGVVTYVERNGRCVRFASGYTGRLIGWLSAHGILFPVTTALLSPRRAVKAFVRRLFKLNIYSGVNQMRTRIKIARLIIRAAHFIKSLSLMVLRPDDIVESYRHVYSEQKTVKTYGETKCVDGGLDTEENELLKKIPYTCGRLLLLGVGGGREAIPLARAGFHITGVDFIPEMLDQAKQNAKRHNLDILCLLQEYSKLDLPEDSYEVAWFSSIMYSCTPTKQRRVEMLKRIHKALRPEGILVCQFYWNSEMKQSKIGIVIRRVFSWVTMGFISYQPGDLILGNTEFFHCFQSEEELNKEFISGGFKLDHLIVNEKTLRGGAILKKI